MARTPGVALLAFALLALPSRPAWAQGAGGIAGVVRDSSGGVLPGVTVEASSAALIERVRSVATDAEGQYKIIDLRPGTYVVTFTLAGFSTLKRELPSQLQFENSSNQTDIRFIKSVRFAGRRLQGIFDIYNAFNARPVLAVNTRYSGTTGGSWLSPTSTLIGRLIKFSAQVNF